MEKDCPIDGLVPVSGWDKPEGAMQLHSARLEALTRTPRFMEAAHRERIERSLVSHISPPMGVPRPAWPGPTPIPQSVEPLTPPTVNGGLYSATPLTAHLAAGSAGADPVRPAVVSVPHNAGPVSPGRDGGAPAASAAPSMSDVPYGDAMQRLSHGLQSLRMHMAAVSEAARSDALEIGVEMARAILQRELATDPQSLVSLVRTAVDKAGEQKDLTVRMHPEDLERLEAALSGTSQGELPMAGLRMQADASLEHGDVVVQGEFGKVDGRVSARLEQMRHALAARAGNQQAA